MVEVDEIYVGGVVPGRRGRGALGKAIVGIAVERLGVGQRSRRVALGRVRLQRIPNVQMATLTDFVLDTCDLDAIIYTDHWVGYNDLGNASYTHVKTKDEPSRWRTSSSQGPWDRTTSWRITRRLCGRCMGRHDAMTCGYVG